MLRTRDDAAAPALFLVFLFLFGPAAGMLVVPAATSYVWVSGFGSQASVPMKSMSLVSAGPLVDGSKPYTVASASSGISYGDLVFTIAGTTWPMQADACATPPDTFSACRSGSALLRESDVRAGDELRFAGVRSGDTLRVLDADANSVILTLTVG